MNKKIITGH